MSENNEYLACPKCHNRAYVFEIKNNKCVCRNHVSWYIADKDKFVEEGNKFADIASEKGI